MITEKRDMLLTVERSHEQNRRRAVEKNSIKVRHNGVDYPSLAALGRHFGILSSGAPRRHMREKKPWRGHLI